MQLALNPRDIFGEVLSPYQGYGSTFGAGYGLIQFINNVLKLLFVIGGLWAFFNLIFAGFQFLNAGGDPKGIETAWNKIWQSLIGLLIIVSSFIIAALVGLIFFGSPYAILWPKIYGP